MGVGVIDLPNCWKGIVLLFCCFLVLSGFEGGVVWFAVWFEGGIVELMSMFFSFLFFLHGFLGDFCCGVSAAGKVFSTARDIRDSA